MVGRKTQARSGQVNLIGCHPAFGLCCQLPRGFSPWVTGVVLGALLLGLFGAAKTPAQEAGRSAQFPVGVIPHLLGEPSDESSLSSRHATGNHERWGSTWVYGPRGQVWRASSSISGGWITDSAGNQYRWHSGLSRTWVTGPRGEKWTVVPKLSGGAWIYGPKGEVYTYHPSLGGGGRIYGPRGQSWSVVPRLSGSFSIY